MRTLLLTAFLSSLLLAGAENAARADCQICRHDCCTVTYGHGFKECFMAKDATGQCLWCKGETLCKPPQAVTGDEERRCRAPRARLAEKAAAAPGDHAAVAGDGQVAGPRARGPASR